MSGAEAQQLVGIDDLYFIAFLSMHGVQPVEWRRKTECAMYWAMFEDTEYFCEVRGAWPNSECFKYQAHYREVMAIVKTKHRSEERSYERTSERAG